MYYSRLIGGGFFCVRKLFQEDKHGYHRENTARIDGQIGGGSLSPNLQNHAGSFRHPKDADQAANILPQGNARRMDRRAGADRGASMSQSKAEAMVTRLLTNAADLKYGSVSVTAKVHDGRVVEVVYATTESTREAESSVANR